MIWVILSCIVTIGCGSKPPIAPQEADAKDRLYKLFNLYRFYIEKNRKGPPSEDALLAFGQKLDSTDREARNLGSDIDSLFVSPRDKKKFVIRYNINDLNAAKAVAWEADGNNGRRCVALGRGNVEEYDQKLFSEYTK